MPSTNLVNRSDFKPDFHADEIYDDSQSSEEEKTNDKLLTKKQNNLAAPTKKIQKAKKGKDIKKKDNYKPNYIRDLEQKAGKAKSDQWNYMFSRNIFRLQKQWYYTKA